MRHQKAGRKLNRTGSHRDAMLRNMVTSLLNHGRVKTTDPKAKELRRWADRMVTLAKRGDLHARRQALSVVRDKRVVHKLFEEASQRFGSRAGGYTRIIKLGRRAGDGAPVSLVELIKPEEKKARKKKKAKPVKKAESKVKTAASKKAETAKPKEAQSPEKTSAEAAEGAPEKEVKPDSAQQPAPGEKSAEVSQEAEQEAGGDADTAAETAADAESDSEEEKGTDS